MVEAAAAVLDGEKQAEVVGGASREDSAAPSIGPSERSQVLPHALGCYAEPFHFPVQSCLLCWTRPWRRTSRRPRNSSPLPCLLFRLSFPNAAHVALAEDTAAMLAMLTLLFLLI